MEFEKFKLIGKDMYDTGLVDSHSGSLSVREGNKIFITRKGAMLGHLGENDILEALLDNGGVTEAGSGDLAVHRAIYKETSFNAIISAKPPHAISFSSISENKMMIQDTEGQIVLKGVPVVRTRGRADMEELSKLLPPIFKSGYFVCVVKELGSYSVGADLSEALKLTSCLETSSKIAILNKQITVSHAPKEMVREKRTGIPPGIGVMGRSRQFKRGLGR